MLFKYFICRISICWSLGNSILIESMPALLVPLLSMVIFSGITLDLMAFLKNFLAAFLFLLLVNKKIYSISKFVYGAI